MTITDTERTFDQFRMTAAPTEWVCNAPGIMRDEDTVPYGDPSLECWGGLMQYEVHRISNDTWERTYKAACQRVDHRSRVTTEVQGQTYYAGVVFVDNDSPDHARLPILFHPPTPEVASVTTTSVELPGHSDLQRRVLAYLLGNDGSVDTRHQAFLYLAERDAFYPGLGDQAVTEHLQMLVEENPMGACSDGIQRFRDALDLPSTLQNWRATLVSHGATVGHIDFTVATTDEDEARRHVDNHVRLSYIDRALVAALEEFDADGFSYSGDFDVLLDEVEHMGPAD